MIATEELAKLGKYAEVAHKFTEQVSLLLQGRVVKAHFSEVTEQCGLGDGCFGQQWRLPWGPPSHIGS